MDSIIINNKLFTIHDNNGNIISKASIANNFKIYSPFYFCSYKINNDRFIIQMPLKTEVKSYTYDSASQENNDDINSITHNYICKISNDFKSIIVEEMFETETLKYSRINVNQNLYVIDKNIIIHSPDNRLLIRNNDSKIISDTGFTVEINSINKHSIKNHFDLRLIDDENGNVKCYHINKANNQLKLQGTFTIKYNNTTGLDISYRMCCIIGFDKYIIAVDTVIVLYENNICTKKLDLSEKIKKDISDQESENVKNGNYGKLNLSQNCEKYLIGNDHIILDFMSVGLLGFNKQSTYLIDTDLNFITQIDDYMRSFNPMLLEPTFKEIKEKEERISLALSSSVNIIPIEIVKIISKLI